MKRALLPIAAFAALAGCAGPIPDSTPQRGVGFGDYQQYLLEQERIRRAREEQLLRSRIAQERPEATGAPSPAQAQRQPVVDPTNNPAIGADAEPVITEEPVAPPLNAITPAPVAVASSEANPSEAPIDISSIISAPRSEAANDPLTDPVISPPQGAATASQPVAPEPQPVQTAGIRPEPTFEPIESQPLPRRQGSSANIVAYALSVQHDPGTSVYPRGIRSESRTARNCARFASPDFAQLEFLNLGGPTRDRKGLDPDGDGFACGWDPRPFRLARQG